MRGVVTLPLRIRQHNSSALTIARFLSEQPAVRFIAYPGLEKDKGYTIAKRQMPGGFGGIMAFGLNTDHDSHNRFVSKLRVITNAVSLGHDESLIVFLGENDERQYLYVDEFHGGFFRLSVGLEDTDDLIKDMEQALKAAKVNSS